MNLRELTVVLFFGIIASMAHGAGVPGMAAIGPTDDSMGSQTSVVFGFNNPSYSIPGGNAVDGVTNSQLDNLPNISAAVAVPEPSTIGLFSLALVGYSILGIRRRRV